MSIQRKDRLWALVFILGQIFVLIVFGFLLDPHSPWYPRCMFFEFTGFYCAGCGTGRAMMHFLDGDILGGFRQNLLLIPGLPLLMATNINAFFRVLGRSDPIPLKRIPHFAIVSLVLIVAFWILRNLPWFPFTFLAPEPW